MANGSKIVYFLHSTRTTRAKRMVQRTCPPIAHRSYSAAELPGEPRNNRAMSGLPGSARSGEISPCLARSCSHQRRRATIEFFGGHAALKRLKHPSTTEDAEPRVSPRLKGVLWLEGWGHGVRPTQLVHQQWPKEMCPSVNFTFPTVIIWVRVVCVWGRGGGHQRSTTMAPPAPCPTPYHRPCDHSDSLRNVAMAVSNTVLPGVTFRRAVVSLPGPWTVTRFPLHVLRRVAAF